MRGIKQLLAHRHFRLLVLVILLVPVITILLGQLASTSPSELAAFCGNDFTQYYAAGRLVLQRANPYDPVAMLAMERSIGWQEAKPILVWNPPWTITLVLPLLALPFSSAAWVWLAINLVLMLICGTALWHIFAPGDQRYWLGMGAVVFFMPTLQALRLGQISPWLLVGITGFIFAVRTRRDGLAGASLALLTIKPHVSYLFLLAVIWWIFRERRWRIVLGAITALTLAYAVVGLTSPGLLAQYLRAAVRPPLNLHSATLGTWLNLAFGVKRYWVQFLPSIAGLILCVAWLIRYKPTWEWPRLGARLLLISSISAVYGWPYDQVVLLPFVVVILAEFRYLSSGQRAVLLSLYALTQLGMVLLNHYGIDAPVFYWFPLVLIGLYELQQAMVCLRPYKNVEMIE